MAPEFEWNQAKTTSSRWSWLGCFVLQTVAVQNNVSGVTAPLDTKCLNANRWRQTIWASLAVSSDIYFQHCFLFVLTLAYIHTLLTFPTTSCLSLCFRLIMSVLLESKVRRTKPNSKNGFASKKTVLQRMQLNMWQVKMEPHKKEDLFPFNQVWVKS